MAKLNANRIRDLSSMLQKWEDKAKSGTIDSRVFRAWVQSTMNLYPDDVKELRSLISGYSSLISLLNGNIPGPIKYPGKKRRRCCG